ncbi:MAG TPA: 2Fe-2S iron-sulfur cluster-binding protein, partial [Paracoccaceae bacterium]|nr:2Fe-2S iron-sulfur cluster-binding protein [Paracoccaceae bacterium]
MSSRLASGGLLIDRSRPLSFSFDGQPLQGYEGDTLASALLANDHVLTGRSFKYHRPRGILASGSEEPNALMGIGEGARFEPNQRATTTALHEGLVAISQNRWPSLKRDVGAVTNWLSKIAPIFPAGFYYKTFLWPRAAWKWVYEPVIRRAAGLGKPTTEADPDRYEHFHAHVDTLVIGGGIAGLAAAREAAESGGEVLLVEQTAHWGGRALVDGDRIDGQDGADWVKAETAALGAMPNVHMRLRAMASGLYDHSYVLISEQVADHRPGLPGAPRHRLWRVRANRIVIATGALERPLLFANNDLPGVMLASAVRDYIRLWGVLPGSLAVVFANNDDAYRTALALHEAGAVVAAVLDTRASVTGDLPARVRALGIAVHERHGIDHAYGRHRVEAVEIRALDGAGPANGSERIECDLVAVSGGWNPAVHLWSHCAGKLRWDEDEA